MGRPRNDSEETPVELRIEEAFWHFVQERPIERITVGALTTRAACNRGTFYYYYDDVYDLLDTLIQKNVPVDIAPALISFMMEGLFDSEGDEGGGASEAVVARLLDVARSERGRLDKLCLLLNSDAAPLVTRKLKAAAIGVWSDVFGIEAEKLPPDARIVFEFMIGGIMGLLAYRAETNLSVQMEDALGVLAPEIPRAILACFRKAMPHDVSAGSLFPVNSR